MVVTRMKIKYFIFLWFTVLLSSIVAVEPFQDMKQFVEIEESKTNIEVDCYAYFENIIDFRDFLDGGNMEDTRKGGDA
ncbi:Nodule-specific Glycine Rich Peptide [Medicago truncatula]|uniref:Nodule-specific Glycine Rich Peptide n=1 Tax=Medicago truncatula TaxID=3880 RepID=A0A072VQJ8_MEDTR|nr:Nodule-specific Glycine Rich Peptide [Medicago truncatula]